MRTDRLSLREVPLLRPDAVAHVTVQQPMHAFFAASPTGSNRERPSRADVPIASYRIVLGHDRHEGVVFVDTACPARMSKHSYQASSGV